MRTYLPVLVVLILGACAAEPVPAPLPQPEPAPTAEPAPAAQTAPEAQPALAPQPAQATPEQESAAREAADRWLEIIDQGEYGESWTESSAMFRQAVTSEQWEANLAQTRQPLGAMESRTFREAQYHTELPNVPAGEYMILTYDARYEGIDRMLTEQLVLTREADGEWRVAGYFAR